MSKRFKLVLLIRFVGYTALLLGIISVIFVFGPLLQAEFKYRSDRLFGVKRVVPRYISSTDLGQDGTQANSGNNGSGSGFGDLKVEGQVITPVDTNFGIVIEKINANSRVIANVDPSDEKAYIHALSLGVAHAAGTNLPGEKGNIYMFSHSTDAPWNVVRYNAVFYLLRELDPGDRVIVFYQDRRYDYIVYDKQIVDPNDVTFLTNKYDQSVLTLQTCDPPGTTLHRLIVRAKLAGS